MHLDYCAQIVVNGSIFFRLLGADMGASSIDGSDQRFSAYAEGLAGSFGHADRHEPMRDYCLGLLMPIARKSVEPMAAMMAPAEVAAKHQSMLHFVGNAPWSDAAVLAKVQALVLPQIERSGPIEAWIVDDTGFPKKGRHSVGVARQYCGQLGKQDNCQVAVSLSVANHAASLPIAYRLYLSEDWANDPERRDKAKVPDRVVFKTKPQIAFDQIKEALATGVRKGVVLADAGYGSDTQFRTDVSELGLTYVMGISPSTTVWEPGTGPLPPPEYSGRGKPATRLRRDAEHQPVSVKALAQSLPAEVWQAITWREGAADWLSSRFTRLRVRPAHRDNLRTEPRAEEWLLIEWPADEKEPTKYWLSTLSEEISFEDFVDTAKLRWRIERDYQELKQELGLGHYEGRGWRGFHHHATLCIAAYGFLITERSAFPPSGPSSSPNFPETAIPTDYRPRGSAGATRTAHTQLDRHDTTEAGRRYHQGATTMSVL
jgi:SRSO17 transposase